MEQTKNIKTTEEQRKFIIRAINNICILYDFTISKKEFKESYGIDKQEIELQIEDLMREVLKE